MTRTRRRLVAAAVVLGAVAADAGLWLYARDTVNNRLGLVLFIVNALVVGGLVCQLTGVFLMRGRGGRVAPNDRPESEADWVDRLTR